MDPHICAKCSKQSERHFKKCAGCRQKRYCSPECQLADWPQHKSDCKKYRISIQIRNHMLRMSDFRPMLVGIAERLRIISGILEVKCTPNSLTIRYHCCPHCAKRAIKGRLYNKDGCDILDGNGNVIECDMTNRDGHISYSVVFPVSSKLYYKMNVVHSSTIDENRDEVHYQHIKQMPKSLFNSFLLGECALILEQNGEMRLVFDECKRSIPQKDWKTVQHHH